MKVFGPDGKEIMAVSSIERDGSTLVVKGKIFGADADDREIQARRGAQGHAADELEDVAVRTDAAVSTRPERPLIDGLWSERMKRRAFLHSAMAGGVAAALDVPVGAGAATSKRGYKLLPCEEAFTIPEILEAARKHAHNVPSWASGPIVGPAIPLLLDLGEGRLRGMDAAASTCTSFAGSPGVENLRRSSRPFRWRDSRTIASPKRSRPSDTVSPGSRPSPQDAAAAVKELQRCRERV